MGFAILIPLTALLNAVKGIYIIYMPQMSEICPTCALFKPTVAVKA